MKKIILIWFLCSHVSGMAQSIIGDSIFFSGQYRDYILYIPAVYNGNSAVPLLFNLHGYTSNANQQTAYGDFRPIADTANFLVVQPNGTFSNGNRFWNAFYQGPPNDMGFLNALVDSLKLSYNIDDDRLYMCGMSNGGIMSYRMACDPANRFAAIGSVTGTMDTSFYSFCNPSRPTPVIEIHGTGDFTVPFNGGNSFEPIDTVIRYWRTKNATVQSPAVYNYPDVAQNDFCTATEYAYLNGTDNSEVVLVKINSGGHTWPGAPVNIGVTNHDFSASLRIWNFFRKYRKSQLTAIQEYGKKSPAVYPNPAGSELYFENTEAGILRMYDAMGNLVKQQAEGPGRVRLSVGELAPGLYTLQCGTWATKFIKQ